MTSETTEVTTNPAAARVQLIAVPIASPGACVLCGKNEHEKGFADPRLDFEFYGTLYLCADCVGDFASLFGWISPDQAILLARRCDYLEKELETHREALLLLESGLEQITSYRMLRSAIPDSSSSDDLDATTSGNSEESNDSVSASVIQFPDTVTTSESDVSESATEQRSDDVSESTGDESNTVPILEL